MKSKYERRSSTFLFPKTGRVLIFVNNLAPVWNYLRRVDIVMLYEDQVHETLVHGKFLMICVSNISALNMTYR